MSKEIEYDKNLWFYHNGCEGQHYLIGNPHTHIGRMYAWCPINKTALCVSEHEMGDMSIESKYWIKGFLSGSEKYEEDEVEKYKLDPYLDHLVKDGRKIKKVHVLYVDGDAKLCDCCDEHKTGVASIRMICGDVSCICKECIEDILTIWK